jgi:hypothetical protein
MKVARWIAPFLLSVALYSSDGGSAIRGKWAVEYVSGLAMKTIGGADFEFKADGNTLTGTANVGHGWPGLATISDGRIDGDRISFTVQGRQWSSTGYPKMRFTGTVRGDEIRLTMDFYQDASSQDPIGQTEFRGRRVSGK